MKQYKVKFKPNPQVTLPDAEFKANKAEVDNSGSVIVFSTIGNDTPVAVLPIDAILSVIGVDC